MLKKLSLYFILLVLAFFLNQAAIAVDSTAVEAPLSAPFRFSYLLYRSKIYSLPNNTDFSKVLQTYTSTGLCQNGFAACVALQEFYSNDFNSSNTGVRRFYKRASIVNNGANYTVKVYYGYQMTSGYAFRGGAITYTVACVPIENIDPDAFNKQQPAGAGGEILDPMCAK